MQEDVRRVAATGIKSAVMLKAMFVRQLDAMHVQLAQGQPLEGAELEPGPIPWQIALNEASMRARNRIVRHHLVHPAYRDAVRVYEVLEARIHIGMLLTVLATGASQILTMHGYTAPFAAWLASRGLQSRPLA